MKSLFEQVQSLGLDLTSLIIRDAVRLHYIEEYNKVVLELQSRYTHQHGWTKQAIWDNRYHAIKDHAKPSLGDSYINVCYLRSDSPRSTLTIYRQLYTEDRQPEENIRDYYYQGLDSLLPTDETVEAKHFHYL